MVKQVEKVKAVETLVKQLLAALEVEAGLKVELVDKEINLDLEVDNPASLIGFHGETLNALQLILSLMAYQKLNDWTRILVDVNGYRKKRFDNLKQMALAAAEKVKLSQQAFSFPPMNARERRIIHLVLADYSGIRTESEGEEPTRKVVVIPA